MSALYVTLTAAAFVAASLVLARVALDKLIPPES
jgi:hypothetical protein